MARRSNGCLTEPEHQLADREVQLTSPEGRVPGQDTGRIPSGGVISELSALARPLGFGLQTFGGATLRCSRLAWSLAGSADMLVWAAIAFVAAGESAEASNNRPRYSLQWISPYESDVWD